MNNNIPKNRKEALKLKEKYYFNGKICPNGHVCKRFSHNGVCYNCVMESNKNWYDKNKLDISWRKKRLFNLLKNRALRKNIPFEIKYNDIVWNTHCPVFGYELIYDNLNNPKNESASFDKVDPTLGYVKGNVIIISHRANWLKQDSNIEQLEKIIKYMKHHIST
jgi:hypothetical protein